MIKCPICQKENQDTVSNCQNCSYDLTPYPGDLSELPIAYVEKQQRQLDSVKSMWQKFTQAYTTSSRKYQSQIQQLQEALRIEKTKKPAISDELVIQLNAQIQELETEKSELKLEKERLQEQLIQCFSKAVEIEALTEKLTKIEHKLLSTTSFISQPEKKKLEKQSDYTENLPNGVKLDLIYISKGEFMMGSNEYGNEQLKHLVTISEPFYLGKYPITQGQYQAVMGKNPSHFGGENNPVDNVSWHDAVEFCQKLSHMTGKKYKLPSEAQWEYACRAGSTGEWFFGDDEDQLKDYAWYGYNSNDQTRAIGQKKPNKLGLYDMYGNVCEWCEDNYMDNYEHAPRDGSAYKNKSAMYVVLRGGCWSSIPRYCRSASRHYHKGEDRSFMNGFRVMCVVDNNR